MVDSPNPAKRDGQDAVQLNAGYVGNLEAARRMDGCISSEHAVAAQTPCLVMLHGVSDLVSSVARLIAVHPCRLIGSLIGHLVLEHDGATVLTIPDHLI